ncbi:MAG: hypothetical protein PQJ46_14355, partial [Spirochaetales bacterium]|nr:hypothetical protein [Spirochaetales bacterium]
DIYYEGFENEVADMLVKNGMGTLFVPSTAYGFHFKEFPPSKIQAHPIHLKETVGQRIMGISRRRSHYMTSSARDVYNYIIEYFNSSSSEMN